MPLPSDRRPPSIRPARPADVPEIHAMVCELAVFEKLRHQVTSTPDDLAKALFSPNPHLEALIAEQTNEHAPVGFALFRPTFSSFTGKPGLWLEDVYVRESSRGQGAGSALLEAFSATARERGCARAEWSVLNWNERAIQIYEKMGAEVMLDWRIARLSF